MKAMSAIPEKVIILCRTGLQSVFGGGRMPMGDGSDYEGLGLVGEGNFCCARGDGMDERWEMRMRVGQDTW